MSDEQLFTPDGKTAGYLPFIRGRRGVLVSGGDRSALTEPKARPKSPSEKKKIAHGSMIEKAGT